MKVQFFYNTDPDSLDEEITKWLDENKDISIFNIKQTALPPELVILNSETLHYDERVEFEAYLVVSVWYT